VLVGPNDRRIDLHPPIQLANGVGVAPDGLLDACPGAVDFPTGECL
jgi:hypothetical protein